MSFQSQSEATKEAERIRRRLRSKGWKIRTWKNDGWNYSLKLGFMTLYSNGLGGFFILTSNSRLHDFGVPEWTHAGAFTDPNQSVKAAVDMISKDIELRTDVFRIMKRLTKERE